MAFASSSATLPKPLRAARPPVRARPEAAATTLGNWAPPELSPEDQAANEQLRRLGYQIHERYNQMPLAQLRQAATAKDVQALTHLAERYLFALDGKPQDPEHEAGFPYREAARTALTEAYLRGNLHAAAMISETFLLERRPLDAAAQNLVVRRSDDALSADWFLKTQDYRDLGEAGQQAAAQKTDTLWVQLARRKKPGGACRFHFSRSRTGSGHLNRR